MSNAPIPYCPEFIALGAMLKATPSTEGDRRILYFEASNEGLDQQGEVVAAKALADSADYFKRYGNLDIDHYTLIGAKAGIPDYPLYEIGRPVEVGQRDGRTFVKGEVYAGAGRAADRANMVWSGLTEVRPPQRWYPSVGGAVLGKANETGEDGRPGRTLITKVRWSNIGLSKTPVNQHVAACATMPIGVFAKCWSAAGLDIAEAMSKALEAGYGTDSADLTGGAALGELSLDGAPIPYPDLRERLAAALRSGELGADPRLADLQAFCVHGLGLSGGDAAKHVERFARDLKQGLKHHER
ncbi:MAG: hypothetical protein WA840_22735 [Caulobacteraceae bacterium]